MTLVRRRFLQLIAGAAALPVPIAEAQSYPTRPVRIIIGFGPSASGDIAARVLAQSLSQQLGQQFIVENRSGAGSNIATNLVAHAPNDGSRCCKAPSPTPSIPPSPPISDTT